MNKASEAISLLYRRESGRILATLIRILGDFDLAEEMVQEAFTAALEQWPAEGMPANPRAWLVQTARHKAIDWLRRRALFEEKRRGLEQMMALEETAPEEGESAVQDDRLRLIFTCCHPSLAVDAQIALTLKTIGGLTTKEIARAFLMPVPTMAQRLVRVKQKIQQAGIPYQVPSNELLPERLEVVMKVVYLVFNEGYLATSGDSLIRKELCAEAIRLARLLCQLIRGQPELQGLLALMLLHDARREARVNAEGEIVLLEDQDRRLWNKGQIREGLELVEAALQAGPPGPYVLQAAIAAVHARAERQEDTDWREIAALYELLERVLSSPVVELNRAVAVAMAEGPEHGLRMIEALEAGGWLDGYYLLHSARADLLRRLSRWSEAADSYRRALSLATNESERRFLRRRLEEVESLKTQTA